ncbi:hypothetical protein PR202_gb02022 [Eleusine coracana subsp. coracana]|uniref:Bifunctional inhibitor/plant lipid transfer protein/seed storage helical domain-containing protein n=1 Tax=Eleusine coracana subsp. coracana TaxID=191504 RepID=A0AAV5DZ14_ELECO|nr:hypothetical protein PR202_gb02022 [Eleusine coracana subsp. coracana]
MPLCQPSAQGMHDASAIALFSTRSVISVATTIPPRPSNIMAGNNKQASLALFLVALTVAGAVLNLAPGANAATCTPMQLTPCAPAIVGNAPPSPACCSKLKVHPATCFCQYKRDPNMKRYVNSPNGKKVFDACRVALPRC